MTLSSEQVLNNTIFLYFSCPQMKQYFILFPEFLKPTSFFHLSNNMSSRRYISKRDSNSTFPAKKRDYHRNYRHSKPSKLNYNLVLESNIKNIDQNLQSDYCHSVDLLLEYFQHNHRVTKSVDKMKIVRSLCHHLPLSVSSSSDIKEDSSTAGLERGTLQLCKFVSLLCISCQSVEWDKHTINMLLSVLIEKVLSDAEIFPALIPNLPIILRTIGHVVFERGALINEETRSLLIAALIPLAAPSHKNSVSSECRIASIHDKVDRLCIEYGITKFPRSQSIATYDSSQQIRQYIQECHQKKVFVVISLSLFEWLSNPNDD